MTQQELNKIVERHQHWLKEDCEGWGDMRADLSVADLRGANLSGANFSGDYLDEKERYRLGQILKEPITGYKKTADGVVITAEIPAGAIVGYIIMSSRTARCISAIALVMNRRSGRLTWKRMSVADTRRTTGMPQRTRSGKENVRNGGR